MVRRDFAELRSRDRPRGARLSEDNFGGTWKEHPGDFVEGFIAARPIDYEDFSSREIFFPEGSQPARPTRVVRAVHIDVGTGLQLFQAPRPNGGRDAAFDSFIRDPVASCTQQARRCYRVDGVLQLEPSRQLWRERRGPA